jgi:NAD(P)-dependent dehydrogenase (short-subunit alcohol dehydrogenase family)
VAAAAPPPERRVAPDQSASPLASLLSLDARVAIVTGGAAGIGLAICGRLAESGARVVVADVDGEEATAAASRLGGAAQPAVVDVAEGRAVRALAERALATYGRLDVWVNAAGIYPAVPVLELSEDDWDRVLAVNLRGTFLGAREAARAMIAAGNGGVILNVTSTAAYRVAGAGVAHYVSSKFGVRGLTKSLACELGPHGIRVLAIAPTVTATPGIEARRAQLEAAGFELETLGARLPLGRIAVPDDVARVALFCASDLAALMTGSTLVVDAGDLAC